MTPLVVLIPAREVLEIVALVARTLAPSRPDALRLAETIACRRCGKLRDAAQEMRRELEAARQRIRGGDADDTLPTTRK